MHQRNFRIEGFLVLGISAYLTLQKKCPFAEVFCFVISRIRTAYGKIQSISRSVVSYLFIYLFYLSFLSRTITFHRAAGNGEGIYLTPLYHFHPLHRHLDISRAIIAERSPLLKASSRTQTGNLWFPSASCWPLSFAYFLGLSREKLYSKIVFRYAQYLLNRKCFLTNFTKLKGEHMSLNLLGFFG